jgi:hypothetical protein
MKITGLTLLRVNTNQVSVETVLCDLGQMGLKKYVMLERIMDNLDLLVQRSVPFQEEDRHQEVHLEDRLEVHLQEVHLEVHLQVGEK